MAAHPASRSLKRPRVLIAYKYVPQYRRAFFDGLRERLQKFGVDLDLFYGDPAGPDIAKRDAVTLPWATHVPNLYVKIGQQTLTYQPIARRATKYDLVIVEQANRLIVNPILLALTKLRIARLAYWGHGKDFQGGDSPIMRRIKRALLPHAHWWFAYNAVSAAVVLNAGFPEARITRVMNTIDSEELKRLIEQVTPAEVDQQRIKSGLKGDNVCIYVGGMYDKKRLSFLIAACERIRDEIEDFEIVFLGGGTDRPLVEEFSAKHEWAKVLGPTFGREKAVFLKLSKLLLMPGLVGLAIIDAFAAQVPIVTTNVSYHSPEIEYLVDGVNGVMVEDGGGVQAYADSVIDVLRNGPRLARLVLGCRGAAELYTTEAMITNFANGILSAIKA